MAEGQFQLPKMDDKWMGIIITSVISICIMVIGVTWIIMGYNSWSVKTVARQISQTQDSSMFSTVLVAAITTAPAEKRAEVVASMCPVVEKKEDVVLSPEGALCETLIKMFAASTPSEALEAVKDVNKAAEVTN